MAHKAQEDYGATFVDEVEVQVSTFAAGRRRRLWKWVALAAGVVAVMSAAAILVGPPGVGGSASNAPDAAQDWPKYMSHGGGWHCHGTTASCTKATNAKFKKGHAFDVNREKGWKAEGCIHPDDWLGKSVYAVSMKHGQGGGMKLAVHNDCKYAMWVEPKGSSCNGKDSGCKGLKEGDGDCDSDADCAAGLKCGRDNCAWEFGRDPKGWPSGGGKTKWDRADDCCYNPASTREPAVCMHINEGPWEWWTLKKQDSQYYLESGRSKSHILRVSGSAVYQGAYDKKQSQFTIEACEESKTCPKANGEYTVGLFNTAAKKYVKVDDKAPKHGKGTLVAGLSLASKFEAAEQFKIVTVSAKRNGGVIVSPHCRSKEPAGNLQFPLGRNGPKTGVCTIKAVCSGTAGSCSTTHGKFLLSNFKDAKTFHWGAAGTAYKWVLQQTHGVTTLMSNNGHLGTAMFQTGFRGKNTHTVAATFPCAGGGTYKIVSPGTPNFKAGTELYRVNAATQTVQALNGAPKTWWSCSKCAGGKTTFGCSGITPDGAGRRYAVEKVNPAWLTVGQYLQSDAANGGEAKWGVDRDLTRAWALENDWRTGLTDIKLHCTADDCPTDDLYLLSNAKEGGKTSLGRALKADSPGWKRKHSCAGGAKVVSLGTTAEQLSKPDCAAACMRHRAGAGVKGNCCQYNGYTNGADRCVLYKSATVKPKVQQYPVEAFVLSLYSWQVSCEAPKYAGVCTIQAHCTDSASAACKATNHKYWSSNLHGGARTSWGGFNSDAGKTSANGYTYSWSLRTSYVGGTPVTTIRSHCLASGTGCSRTHGKYFQSDIKNGGSAKWGDGPDSNFAWVFEDGPGGVTFIKRHCTGGGCAEHNEYLRSDSKEDHVMSVGPKTATGKFAWKVHCTHSHGTGSATAEFKH